MELTFRTNIDTRKSSKKYHPYLFNLANHRLVQREEGWHSFYLIDEITNEVFAEFHGNLLGVTLKSPAMSPFGGINCSKNLSQDTLKDFLVQILSYCRDKEIKEVIVKGAPEAYPETYAEMMFRAFQSAGFEHLYSDPHWVIGVNDNLSFEKQLRSAEYGRRMRKLVRNGYIFTIENHSNSFAIWDFIVQCRKERKYRFSMTYELLDKYLKELPESVHLFSVRYEGRICAAAICFQINRFTMYDFSHGHSREFDKSSPVLLLISGIYEYCQDQKMEILDLGASSIAQKPNLPLISFKESLGAKRSEKDIWRKLIE